jgi:hypothetical protein
MFMGCSASWLLGCGGAQPQATTPHGADPDAGTIAAAATSPTTRDVSASGEVIGSLAAVGHDAAMISLIRRDCGEEDCVLSVATEGGSGHRELMVGWRVPVGPISPVGEGTSPDIFVLAPSLARRAWTIGEEESAATISLVALNTPGPASFLLEAEMGFEHVKRSHLIVASTPEGWVRLWSRDDPQGPHRTAIGGVGNGGQVVYFDAFLDPDAKAPDSLNETVLVLQGSAAPPREQSLSVAGVSVLVLPLARFSAPAAAKAARAQRCLADTLALPTARFDKAPRNSVSLVKVGLDTALIAAEAARIAECTGKPVPDIRRLGEAATSKE